MIYFTLENVGTDSFIVSETLQRPPASTILNTMYVFLEILNTGALCLRIPPHFPYDVRRPMTSLTVLSTMYDHLQHVVKQYNLERTDTLEEPLFWISAALNRLSLPIINQLNQCIPATVSLPLFSEQSHNSRTTSFQAQILSVESTITTSENTVLMESTTSPRSVSLQNTKDFLCFDNILSPLLNSGESFDNEDYQNLTAIEAVVLPEVEESNDNTHSPLKGTSPLIFLPSPLINNDTEDERTENAVNSDPPKENVELQPSTYCEEQSSTKESEKTTKDVVSSCLYANSVLFPLLSIFVFDGRSFRSKKVVVSLKKIFPSLSSKRISMGGKMTTRSIAVAYIKLHMMTEALSTNILSQKTPSCYLTFSSDFLWPSNVSQPKSVVHSKDPLFYLGMALCLSYSLQSIDHFIQQTPFDIKKKMFFGKDKLRKSSINKCIRLCMKKYHSLNGRLPLLIEEKNNQLLKQENWRVENFSIIKSLQNIAIQLCKSKTGKIAWPLKSCYVSLHRLSSETLASLVSSSPLLISDPLSLSVNFRKRKALSSSTLVHKKAKENSEKDEEQTSKNKAPIPLVTQGYSLFSDNSSLLLESSDDEVET